MNVQGLITNAIYLSLQDREQQPLVDSGYVNIGLMFLNFLLDEWRDKIPFAQQLQYTSVATFDNLSYIQTNFQSVSNVNYIVNNVIISNMREVGIVRWNEQTSVRPLSGIPVIYYWEELEQRLFVYPSPSNPSYIIEVWGRVSDNPVSLFDPIPINIPQYQVNALIYELAFRLAGNYGVLWNDSKEATRQTLLKMVNDKKDIDLTAAIDIELGMPDMAGIPPFPVYYFMSGGSPQ